MNFLSRLACRSACALLQAAAVFIPLGMWIAAHHFAGGSLGIVVVTLIGLPIGIRLLMLRERINSR